MSIFFIFRFFLRCEFFFFFSELRKKIIYSFDVKISNFSNGDVFNAFWALYRAVACTLLCRSPLFLPQKLSFWWIRCETPYLDHHEKSINNQYFFFHHRILFIGDLNCIWSNFGCIIPNRKDVRLERPYHIRKVGVQLAYEDLYELHFREV